MKNRRKPLKKKAVRKKPFAKPPPSVPERAIRKFLKAAKIKFTPEFEHKTLLNPLTKGRLRLDFYLPEYNVAIEYDGKTSF